VTAHAVRSGAALVLRVPAGQVVTPADLRETVAILRAGAARKTAFAFVGGGTELGFGNPPARVDTLVRTERLKRVVEYAPSDMVVTVEAGLTLAALQRALLPQRQRLALDAPLPERATIGGLLATGSFGPRRARYGRLRDLIVGISIVRADGEQVRGGGKVVKNVAGFDLPKLMVGSFGTLGMIVTATFRLHPLPESARWIRAGPLDAAQLRDIVVAVGARQLEPAAYLAERTDGRYVLYALFEGFPSGVDEQVSALTELLAKRAIECSVAGENAVAAIDESARSRGELRLRISAPAACFEEVDRAALDPLQRTLEACSLAVYPSLGIAFAAGKVADASATTEALVAARRFVEGLGGNLVLTEVPDSLEQVVDRFGTLPPSFGIMRRLKERFDPDRRLNPGRFAGGL
jgi:glycolate oxidase FAD binding subunit